MDQEETKEANSLGDPPPDWIAALEEGDLPQAITQQRYGLSVTREEAGAWARSIEALDVLEAHEKGAHKLRLAKLAAERKRLEWWRPAVTAVVKGEVERLKAVRKSARKEINFEFEDAGFSWAPDTTTLKLVAKSETIEYVPREEGKFLAWDAGYNHLYTRWKPHLPAGTKADWEMVSAVFPQATVTVEPMKDMIKGLWAHTGVVPPGWRLVPSHDEVRTEATFKVVVEGGVGP